MCVCVCVCVCVCACLCVRARVCVSLQNMGHTAQHIEICLYIHWKTGK